MLNKRLIRTFFWMFFCSLSIHAQIAGFPAVQGERTDAEAAMKKALQKSSLTFEGRPFHVVMDIGSQGEEYSGRVEVWWISDSKYRVVLKSPKFSQEMLVNGDAVSETNLGDYYPRWLENFVLAILNPAPMAKNFSGRGDAVMLGPQLTSSCLRRDDRPGGITDQMTWGMVCFSGSEPHLASVLTMNMSLEFKDWKGFGKKQIARTYQTDVLDYKPVIGHLTTLEEIKKPDDAMFAVSVVTPVDQRISTEFVSTLKEESLVETVPEISWPSVREGKTGGYMIVYARADRTGQVRETAKHNSDQPGLESFGMQQALRYKFKPLVVDGSARQMEMPLVLHFMSRLEDPLPILSAEQMKKQMAGCSVGFLPAGTPKGTSVTIRVSVNEEGKMTGMGPVGSGTGSAWLGAMFPLRDCKFAPYIVGGKATYYKGDVVLTAP
jgi:hypothetical protein